MSARRIVRPAAREAAPRRGMNPGLVRRIEATIGRVRIANEGEPARFLQPTRDPSTGRMRVNVDGGEYYVSTCPYCGGHNKLWIHYRFGTQDPDLRQDLTWLATCYKSGCLSDPENGRDFRERLLSLSGPRQIVYHVDESAAVETVREAVMPGDCVLLDALPKDHRARRYLEGRGFDPDRIALDFAVSYCAIAAPDFRDASGRIIIPVFDQGELVNWQARRLDDDPYRKYYNLPGGKLHRYLYNVDAAASASTLVIVEGVTSVWRIGAEAIAMFGKSVSRHQEHAIGAWHARTGGKVVLALDREAEKEIDKFVEKLGRVLGDDLVVLELPDDRDPADYTTSAIRRLIARVAPGFPT